MPGITGAVATASNTRVELFSIFKMMEIKDSRIKNQKEKAIKAIDLEYDGAYDYQQMLDAPRRYLEKKYPIFYKQFEKKFNQFINDWDSKTGGDKIHVDFKKDLFAFFCRMINAEIEAEYDIKSSIEYVEKNGLQKVKHNRITPMQHSFDQEINILFEVPELIIASFVKSKAELQAMFDKWDRTYGKYDKRIFRKALQLQQDAETNRMKLTNENAIVKANEVLKIYDHEKLINVDGQKTHLLFNMAKTYSTHHKGRIIDAD